MKQCTQCAQTFTVSKEEITFYLDSDIPEPTQCPDCRCQQRMAWRNERTLYPRKCDLCGKDAISIFSPDAPFPVYCYTCWWSDSWDPHNVARDVDFSRPFFDQYAELLNAAPKLGLLGMGNENSLYTNACYKNKDCYLLFASGENQNVMYGKDVWRSRDSLDVLGVRNSEKTYQAVDCQKLYNCRYCVQSDNCNDSLFLFDCRGCANCFGCINLRNKQFHIYNEQFSEGEYSEKVAKILANERDALADNFFAKSLWEHVPSIRKYARIMNSENCTGDVITNSHNCKDSYYIDNLDTCRHVAFGYDGAKDVYDAENFDTRGEKIYDCISIAGSRLYHCVNTWFSDFCTYGYLCMNCTNTFGCASLKGARFCILNKSYSEQEYTALRVKLVEHMKETGEYAAFFPRTLAPFAYNETVAQEYFPLSKDEALRRGWRWQDNLHSTMGKETKDVTTLPRDIREVDDSIIRDTLACQSCQRNYKITKQELRVYRDRELPIPKQCPDCRHLARKALRNPRHLWHRQCMCDRAGHDHTGRCSIQFETTYAPERTESVYCEQCYRAEIV